MIEKRVRVKEELYEVLRGVAKEHGVSMSSMIGIVMKEYRGVSDEIKQALVEDGVIEGFDGSWGRDIKSSVAVNVFTNRLLGLLAGSVRDPRVRDKKSYLEWLVMREYEELVRRNSETALGTE